MANYDSGTLYDSGAPYDAAAGPVLPQTPKKNMSKVKLNLKAKGDDAFKSFCENHVAQITGNANFAAPIPDAAAYDGRLSEFSTKLAAFRDLEDAVAQARIEKDAARAALELATTGRGNYVETAADGDAAKIVSAGFEVKGQAAPIGELPAPIDVLAKMGAQAGQIVITWRRLRGANSYLVECREHEVAGSPWEQVKVVTAARLKVDNLTAGTIYAFRVRAVGAAGESPWSDETVKMAP
ncbi:MAG: fibronectin type III domain-containing protein [Akkermansiaceae bacterium]|nr:fibronectin type III domain-containing protein [Akkermansiaceae bacterium]